MESPTLPEENEKQVVTWEFSLTDCVGVQWAEGVEVCASGLRNCLGRAPEERLWLLAGLMIVAIYWALSVRHTL